MTYALLPGSGSAGLVWEPVAAQLQGATVLPLPDERDVAAMAAALAPSIEALPRPRVLVGSSLGALVALELARLITRDFEARGQAVLLRHMRVLAGHRPEPLADPPPTLVLWGTQDPGVSLAAHVELALGCDGLLVPIADAGHLSYLERPLDTVRWIRRAGQWASSAPTMRGSMLESDAELKSA